RIGPSDAIALDPVVRAARKAPIADRRLQPDRAAAFDQTPFRGLEGCHDLKPASAAAKMRRCRIATGDEEDAGLKPVGNEFHELRLELRDPRHFLTSAMISPAAIEKPV